MKFFKRLTGQTDDLLYTGPTGAYLVVDVETSGLYPSEGHRLTWMAAAHAHEGAVNPAFSGAVKGTDGLAVFGDAPASVPRYSRGQIVSWMSSAAQAAQAVAAHNAAFDARFIVSEFAAEKRAVPPTPWLCTMLLARHFFPQWPNHKLQTCLQQAGIPTPPAHDAGSEAVATAQLLEFLIAAARSQGVNDLSGLLAIAQVDPVAAARDAGSRPSAGGGRGASVTIDVASLTWDDINRPRTVCGDLFLDDITDPAHRAAHEQVDALFGDGRDERIAAYQALTDAGCPNAAKEWVRLPYWWGKGNRGEFDGAMFVLKKFQEMDVQDTEMVRGLCVGAAFDVIDLKDGPKLLLKAQRDHGEWLSTFGPCEMCARANIPCTCFDFSVHAANLLRERIPAAVMTQLAENFWSDEPDGEIALDKPLLDPLVTIRDSYPAGNAYLMTHVAQQIEKSGDIDTARRLFERAIATDYATDTAYERLSLMAERAKEFSLAAELAEEGIRRTSSTTMTNKLTKRAERCRAKA